MGVYLAMTQAELRRCPHPQAGCGWLACHFSSADSGLGNLPAEMPEHGLLCIDDSLLPDGHDPRRIANQVLSVYEKFDLAGIVMDFQKPYFPHLAEIAGEVARAVPCPAAVTPAYAEGWDGAVFLPPVPPNRLIREHTAPWCGRELWLELSAEALCMVLTADGCTELPTDDTLTEPVFHDGRLHCHYHTHLTDNSAVFTLARGWQDIMQMLEEGRQYGVTNAIGLYQEFYLSTTHHTVG